MLNLTLDLIKRFILNFTYIIDDDVSSLLENCDIII
jgi:hypothetical protein